jgi:transposase
MSRPPAVSHQEKTRIILDVLAGRLTLTAAADEAGVSAQSVANWRRQFIDAGSRGLRPHYEQEAPSLHEARLRHLTREVQRLKLALAEAHLSIALHGPPGGRAPSRH